MTGVSSRRRRTPEVAAMQAGKQNAEAWNEARKMCLPAVAPQPPGPRGEALQCSCSDHTQTQLQTRRPRRHQQRQTRRRRPRRGPGPTQTCVFSIQSSRDPGMRSSSGIALAVSELTASPAAATAAPHKIPRVNARRSISFIERFLRTGSVSRPAVLSGAGRAGSRSRFRYDMVLAQVAADSTLHVQEDNLRASPRAGRQGSAG